VTVVLCVRVSPSNPVPVTVRVTLPSPWLTSMLRLAVWPSLLVALFVRV